MEVRNVNRVHETPGLKLEKELLKSETDVQSQPETIHTEYHVPPHVGETVVLQPGQKAVYRDSVQTADGQRAGQVGYTDLIEEAFRQFPPVPEFGKLEKFRKEVIAAFKHLGLDVNKFFGAQ